MQVFIAEESTAAVRRALEVAAPRLVGDDDGSITVDSKGVIGDDDGSGAAVPVTVVGIFADEMRDCGPGRPPAFIGQKESPIVEVARRYLTTTWEVAGSTRDGQITPTGIQAVRVEVAAEDEATAYLYADGSLVRKSTDEDGASGAEEDEEGDDS